MTNEFILITGAAGFIGTHLFETLSRRYKVVGVDNFNPQIHAERLDKEANNVLHFDIGKDDFEVLRHYGKPVGVIHLAAETGTSQSMYQLETYYRTNLLGTARLLDFVAQNQDSIENFVFASSRSVYGEGQYYCDRCNINFKGERKLKDLKQKKFDVFCQDCGNSAKPVATPEGCAASAVSQYALTKICCENSIDLALSSTGINYTSLRFQNVYGAGQSLNNPYTGVLGIFATLALSNKPINIFEAGGVRRDFVHVSDVVSVIDQILTIKPSPKILNVGTGDPISLLDVATLMTSYYNSTSSVVTTDDFRVGDISVNYADLTLFQDLFPEFQFKNFSGNIKPYLDWVQYNGGIDLANFNRSLIELKSRGLLLK